MPNSTWLIYGANGYTGELIAREAVQRGLQPILAGRNRERIAALANELNLDYRITALDDRAALETALKDVAVVAHCAGPFSRTATSMITACLRTRTHYLDITGEIAVFEAIAARDLEAKAAGIMLLPGAGFDVVPTDCTAAYLKAQLPTATHLTLAFRGLGRTSRGTTLTVLEGMAQGGLIRRNGQLTPVPSGWKTRAIDFGSGPTEVVTVPWGDVATAYHSTGIPNIEVYAAFPPMVIRLIKLSRLVNPLVSLAPVQALIRGRIAAQPPGPTEAQRARSHSEVWGEVRDEAGRTATLRLAMAGGYTITVLTTLDIVRRALGGHAPIGFQTPASAYGFELIFGIESVRKSG
jgi:short subunit dehydrogenase-like uncharacterized protein